MTDRHSGYLVVLDHDIREDDAEHIINAIRMVKGVQDVQPVPARGYETVVAESRRDTAWQDALRDLWRNGPEGKTDA